MQALQLRSAAGWRWVTGGWRLFRRQPFSFAALLFFYWLLLLCASAIIGFVAQAIGTLLPFVSVEFVAAIGSLLVAVLTPILTVGFLQACRTAHSGQPVHPLLLFAPFRAGRQTLSRLLVLGSFQMVALICILFFTNGFSGTRDAAPVEATTPPAASAGPDKSAPGKSLPGTASAPPAQPTAAQQEDIRREAIERMAQGLAYLPVALLMWYAPMLVAWHGLPPGKALFFSLVAVWRNRGAFVVYGIGWLAIWLALSVLIALVTSLIGIGNLTALIAAPLVMLLFTCMYCSVYPTYATVFVDPVGPIPSEPSPV